MVAKDYALTLPNFENFLCEWGFDFGSSVVKDEKSILDTEGDKTTIAGNYNTDEESYGYMLYGDFASLSSAPSMVFTNTGYIECSYAWGTSISEDGADAVNRTYEPLFTSSESARAYRKNSNNGLYDIPEKENTALHLAAVSTRTEMNSVTAEFTYYVYQYRRAYKGVEVHIVELRQLYRAYSSGASEDKEYVENVASEYVAEGYAYILLACGIHRHCKFGQ